MSRVSGIVLMISAGEEVEEGVRPAAVRSLDDWCAGNGCLPLVDVTDMTPRGKHPQVLIYGGGYNNLDEEAFAAAFMAQAWECPENAVLIINPEEGPAEVYRPHGWRSCGG